MAQINTGGHAFPTPQFYDERLIGQYDGLSARDYFAAAALQGILANSSWNVAALEFQGVTEQLAPVVAARMALAHADAMIAERTRKTEAR